MGIFDRDKWPTPKPACSHPHTATRTIFSRQRDRDGQQMVDRHETYCLSCGETVS